jgi:hypothetical protein
MLRTTSGRFPRWSITFLEDLDEEGPSSHPTERRGDARANGAFNDYHKLKQSGNLAPYANKAYNHAESLRAAGFSS